MDVYHAERWGNGQSFRYAPEIPADGLYTLVLKFSEVYFQEPGQKIFDVKIGSQTVLGDLDIFGRLFSRGIPLDEFIEFTVKQGKVFIDGVEAIGGIKGGKLQIEFAVGRADNPKVNAIVIVEGGKGNTHYSSFQKYLKALEEIKSEQMN